MSRNLITGLLMNAAVRYLMLAWSILLVVGSASSTAVAQCSDWYRDVALPQIGCSPQAIEEICRGLRPKPTGPPCEVPAQPRIDTTGTPFQQFRSLATASRIDLNLHPTYTEQYFQQRARLICGLLRAGEIVKLTTEIARPPVVVFSETPQDRPRLETAIMRIGVGAYCPDMAELARQWEATNVR